MARVQAAVGTFRLGLVFAIASAAAFGMSGPLAKSLLEAGWSPAAAVTARLAGGALVLAVFATLFRPGWVREAVRHRRTVVVYGVIPVAGTQLAYYYAVSYLSVGVALLLEYTAPILVVGWLWLIHRRTPPGLTLAGTALAVAGMTLVLDAFSGAHFEVAGLAWGLAAAVCAACYFLMSDRAGAGADDLHPVTLATGGLLVGAATVAAAGAVGITPLTFTTDDTVIAGVTTSWLVPVLGLGVIATATAYTLGIIGIALLRPRFAALVGLSEVMFAVVAAWLLVGETVTPAQAVGGLIVLVGLALARQGDRRAPETAAAPGLTADDDTDRRVAEIH
ncbi:EamA family transporter [Mycolicibacterium thermoresistibile]